MRTRLSTFTCILVVVIAASTASALQMNPTLQSSPEGISANVTDQATSCSYDKNSLTPSTTPPPGCGPLNKSDWPQWMHDAGHSGYNPDERVIDPSNVGWLQALWWMYNPFGDLPYTYVVANGMLYVLGFDYTTWQRGLFAVRGTTGGVFVVKWMIPDFQLSDGCFPSYGNLPRLTVDGGIVYLGCREQSYLIDAASGAISEGRFGYWSTIYRGEVYTTGWQFVAGPDWVYELNFSRDCDWSTFCAPYGFPAIDSGIAYWNYGRYDAATWQCIGSDILAMNAADGTLVYYGQFDDCDRPDPVAAKGVVYVVGNGALNAYGNRHSWGIAGLGEPIVSLEVGKASAMGYAACGQDLCAFALVNGKIIWTAPGGGAPLAAANGVVYATGGAYDAKTGRWLGAVTSGMGSGFVANGMVYVSDGYSLTAYGARK